jgi:diamine N-acetyltransferase
MTVTLRDVTRENYEKVGALQLLESQRKYLASNAFSLAQLHFYPDFRPRAIYSDEELVGFLMYAPLTEHGKPHDYKIFRFMIDHRHQGNGVGRQALQLALDEIRQNVRVDRIEICYKTDNPVAKDFYTSFGFVESGFDEEGNDVIAEIVPSH